MIKTGLFVLASLLLPTRASADCFTSEQARSGHLGWVEKSSAPTLCLDGDAMKPRCLELGDAGQRLVIGKAPPVRADVSSSGRHAFKYEGGVVSVCATAPGVNACSKVKLVDLGDDERASWDATPNGDRLVVYRTPDRTTSVLEVYDVSANKRESRHQVTNPVLAPARVIALNGATFVGNRETVLRFEPTVATSKITGATTAFRMGKVTAPYTGQLIATVTDDGKAVHLLDRYGSQRIIALPEITNGETPIVRALPWGNDLYLAFEAPSRRPAEYPRWDATVLRIDVASATVVGRRSLRCD